MSRPSGFPPGLLLEFRCLSWLAFTGWLVVAPLFVTERVMARAEALTRVVADAVLDAWDDVDPEEEASDADNPAA